MSKESGETPAEPISPPKPKFVEWVYETYQDQLRLAELEGSKRFGKFIRSATTQTFPLSGARRVQSFHIVKFGYPMRRAGYVTVVFVARVTGTKNKQTSSYYAYAYWPRTPGKRVAEPEYICTSSTFESRDGEYRHRFLWYKQFADGYDSLEKVLSPIEETLLEMVAKGELVIDLLYFAGDDDQTKDMSYANDSRLGIKALVAAVATDALHAGNKNLQVHASTKYIELMAVLHRRCKKILETWNAGTHHNLAVFKTGMSGAPFRTQIGQKLTPLTVHESLQVGNINFAPWRESWVGRNVTDLIINGVAPMFPIYNNWTYLDGVDQSLFENRHMRTRYTRSLQAEGVSSSLRQARITAQQDGAETDYRMGQFDARIYDAILYAQDYVLLTGLAMCATQEHVGYTVQSMSQIVRRAEEVSPAFLRMYSEPGMQVRYLFDLCYAALVMHSRTGAIHADLHLNNMTIYELSSQYAATVSEKGRTSYVPRYSNPIIAYVAGPRGEADTYVFPHDGWFACLIDFSRSILGPTARPAIVSEQGETFATNFYRSQVTRALRVFHHYVPSYVEKHQEKIKGLLLSDFDLMFRVMSAVDYLAIGRNYGSLLKELSKAKQEPEDRRKIEVSPEGVKLAAEIERRALEHLIIHLTNLVEGKGSFANKTTIGLAGDSIIPAVFGGYRYSAWADDKSPVQFPLAKATLVDAYNINVDLKYSGSDYARFPPWARFDVLSRHLGGIKMDNVTADRGERPFLESRDLNGYLAVLQEQIRKTAEDRPAAATSSWIAD